MPSRLLVVFAAFALLVAACGDDGGDSGSAVSASEGGSDSSGSSSGGGDARVKEAQELLTSIGCDPGGTDGVAGPSTTRAIEQFQATLALPVSGELDDATLDALRTAEQEGGTVCNDDGGDENTSGGESLTDPASTFSAAELELYRDLVARAFSGEGLNCEGVLSTSEVGGDVQFTGTAEGLLEGSVTWSDGRGVTVQFSFDTTDDTTTFFADVCGG